VRADRENLDQQGGLEAGLGQLDRSAQTSATGADDDCIKLSNGIANLTVAQTSSYFLPSATRTLSEAFDQLKAELVTS
jgi:hypothetical protein